MIFPYIEKLVSVLQRDDVHDAVIRNAVRVLQEIEIPEAFHGTVMKRCFALLENPTTAVAIEAFSLITLFNLSKIYPEIIPELNLIIEERRPHEAAASRSRATKILAAFDKQKIA